MMTVATGCGLAFRSSARNEDLARLPGCAGVYRLLDIEGNVLYIGKSVNIRNRVRTHLACGGKTARQKRMVSAIHGVEYRPTAGEVGALLLENAAIKREMPTYNRRQRAMRSMWSYTLEHQRSGFLQPHLRAYSMDRADVRATYGCYGSRYHGRKALEKLARDEALCPRALALERGRGPCFQYQIRRCRGACVGEEKPEDHNARLLNVLEKHRLSAWPVTTPVLLQEIGVGEPAPDQEWHLLHNWIYLGTFSNPEEARRADPSEAVMFDRDTYRILRSALRRSDVTLFDLETLAPVAWADRGLGT